MEDRSKVLEPSLFYRRFVSFEPMEAFWVFIGDQASVKVARPGFLSSAEGSIGRASWTWFPPSAEDAKWCVLKADENIQLRVCRLGGHLL